ncbi:MAG TPA: hypothetical protein VK900_15280 [Anaerolineales bacterium]|nr:hypothetical protein [Anaerolineales bacterium]
MNFNFGEVLSRAWQIVWRHKVLWIFGIFAGCSRGGGGNSGGSGNTGFETQSPNLPPEVLRWFEIIQENLMLILALGLTLICLFWILSIFLGTIGRIGLIRGTSRADAGTENLIFGELFSESLPYFWRIFGLSLLLAIPALVVIAVVFAGVLAFVLSASGGGDEAVFGLVAMVPLIIACVCIFVPIMIVIGLIVRQAERAIVLENMSVFPALSRGWDVFRNNLGPIIVMAVILFIINLAVSFVIAIPVFLIVLPTMFAFIAGGAQHWTPLAAMGVGLCLYIPVSLVLNGIAIAFAESAWTLTYLRLTRPPADSPLIVEANA